MSIYTKTLMLGAAGLALAVSAPANAETAAVKAETTTTVTTETNVVKPDGDMVYEKHSIETKGDAGIRPVTFYYFDSDLTRIVAASELTEEIFDIWDKDSNGYIALNEYHDNGMVMYEPIEYSSRTYQDIDADGNLELTKEEYTFRLQQLEGYQSVNTDGEAGISAAEFVDAGFQITDDDDDNQISYEELKEAFYGQKRLASEPEIYNQ